MITFELLSPGKHLPVDYWTELVPGLSRVEVELGPGDGRFLIESARHDPTTLFVGLEIRAGFTRQIVAASDLPPNLRSFHCDGRWIVSHLLADDTIDAFHIYFPDPWWKKKHHKRRLFTCEFVAGLQRSLRVGASVYTITDVEPVQTDSRERLVAAGLRETEWTRCTDSPAQSLYERKYRLQGRRLFEARFVKDG